MEAVNSHITQNNKIKQHTLAIYRLLRPTSCKHTHTPAALQQTFQALYLLHKALHSHHILMQQTAESQIVT